MSAIVILENGNATTCTAKACFFCRKIGFVVSFCLLTINIGVYFHINGDVYNGEFANNVMEGVGTYRKMDGQQFSGEREQL